MTITDLNPGDEIVDTWIDAMQNLANGLFGSSLVAMTGTTQSVTTSFADVAGASLSVTVVGANAFALVTATFDVNPTVTTSNNVFVGILNVDGTGQTPEAHCDDRVSRITCTQTYKVALSAGTHTLKLQVKKTAGTFTLDALGHTSMSVLVIDLP